MTLKAQTTEGAAPAAPAASQAAKSNAGETAATTTPQAGEALLEVSLADLAGELGVQAPPTEGSGDSETGPDAGAAEAGSDTNEPAEEPDADAATADEAGADGAATSETEEETDAGDNPDKGVPEWARKRFGELTARAKQAEEQAKRLEQELAAVKAGQPAQAPRPADPADAELDAMESVESLDQYADRVLAAKEWALRNLDGGTVRLADGKEEEISAEKAREILANAERKLARSIPARRTYLEQRKQADAAARQVFPWMADAQHPATQELQRVKRTLAGRRVADIPQLDIVLADHLVGEQIRAGHLKLVPATAPASNGSKVATPAAPKVPTAPIRPATTRPLAPGAKDRGRVIAADERLKKTGSKEALEAAIEARL